MIGAWGDAPVTIPYLDVRDGIQVGLGMTPMPSNLATFKLCLAPRMERPDLHRTYDVPAYDGFKAAMLELLAVQQVDALGSESRSLRRFKKGGASIPLDAKKTARVLVPYVLRKGTSRGKAGLSQSEGYSFLSGDVDHAPLSVAALIKILRQATAGHKAIVHTTWSCKDGDSGARVHVPLSRLATRKEAIVLWWWLRSKLREHGLPEAQVSGLQPVLDPIFEDGQAYLLPAVPASGVVGEEGWGGTVPTGFVSEDGVPLLDVDSILKNARAIMKADLPTYRELWPSVTPPGAKAKKGSCIVGANASIEPFDEVAFEGTDLRAWIVAHLAPGTEQLVGSPWKDSCSGLAGGSCLLHHDADGKIWAYDFANSFTHFDDANDYSSTHTRRAGTESVYQDDRGLMVYLDRADLVQDRYVTLQAVFSKIKAGLQAGIVFDHKALRAWVIEAGQGRGKSEIFARYIQEQRALDPSRVDIIVAPTRTLAAAAARRFDVPLYSDSHGQIVGSSSVCINSFYRVPTVCQRGLDREGSHVFSWGAGAERKGIDCLILDESEQLLTALSGRHFKDWEAQRAYGALVEQVRSAVMVVCLDANAGPLTLGLLRDAGVTSAQTIWVVAPPPDAREIRTFASKAQWVAQLVAACRTGCQAIASHTPEGALGLKAMLPLWNGLPTLVLSAPEIQEHGYNLNDINGLLLQHGHVIYTPAVGTGVSIDLVGRYERVWAELTSSVGTAQHALQLLTRVRSPISPEIHLCTMAGGGTHEAWEKDEAEVLDRWMRAEKATMTACGFKRELPYQQTEDDGQGGWRLLPSIKHYMHHCARTHVAQVRSGLGRAVPALQAYARQIGWTVTPVDQAGPEDREALAEYKSAKGAVTEAIIQRVVSTPDLDEPTLKAVRAHGPSTTAEAIGLRRASIDRVYGAGSANREDVVRYDDSGRGRAHIYAYSDVKAVRAGGIAIEALRRIDEAQLQKGVSAARLTHRLVRARALSHLIMKALPVDVLADSVIAPVVDLPVITVEHDHAKQFIEYLQSPDGVKLARHAGIKLRKDADTSPISQVSAVLRAVGIELKARQVRNPDDKNDITRVYSVDVEALQELHARARHYLGRLLAGEVLNDESLPAHAAPEGAVVSCGEDDMPAPAVTTEREITVDEYVERTIESTWQWMLRDVIGYKCAIFPGIQKIVFSANPEDDCVIRSWASADRDHRYAFDVQEEGLDTPTLVLAWSPTVKDCLGAVHEQHLPSSWSGNLPANAEVYDSVEALFENRFDFKGLLAS